MDENKEVTIESVSVNDTENVEQTPDMVANDTQSDAPDVIGELQKTVSELNDKYLRTAAELENTRRRSARDIESVSRNRAMAVANDFLPVMDAIVAAIKQSPDDAGIKSMMAAMESAFARIGIVKIESVGQILNPQFHNAIQVVEKPTLETPSNTIVDELQTGYMFGDTVMRPAMVVVCK